MSGSSQKILVVDDQQHNRDLIGEIMTDNYQISFAATGEECIEISEEWNPDIILMDVCMPGMGGLEACKKVKEKSADAAMSVIFLSSLSEETDRLAGYEAGGDDYILKPFNHDELMTKVKLALENKTKIEGFRQSSNDAMSMAMTAMSQASDVGNILRFYQNSFVLSSADELAKLLLETILSFGVNAILYFNINNVDYYYSNSGVIKPLEKSAIENLREKGRIYSFSKRTIFNYGVVSALVVDMPIDNEMKYGELKDNIAIIIEGAESRANALTIQLDRDKQHKENVKIIKATEISLAALVRQQASSRNEHNSMMNDLVSDIQESFIRLGLTEAQETELLASLEIVSKESNKLFEMNSETNLRIKNVIELLNNTH